MEDNKDKLELLSIFKKDSSLASLLNFFKARKNLTDIKAAIEGIEIPKDLNIKLDLNGLESISLKGEKGDKPTKGVDYHTDEDFKDWKVKVTPKKGVDYFDGEPGLPGKTIVGPPGPPGPKGDTIVGPPDTAQDIVKKIKGVFSFYDLKDRPYIPVNEGSSGRTLHRGGGSTVLAHDLSSDLDGVTKTFSIPSNSSVLMVVSSSFPTIFRPTIDYTRTGSSITFTSEITAATTLASGQSIIILYVQ